MLLRRTFLGRLSASAFAGALVKTSQARADTPARQTILIIRHAEKQDGDPDLAIDANGADDPSSLTTRGWQRAGAWAELFAPSLGQPSALPIPQTIFASVALTKEDVKAGKGVSISKRPVQTVTALADKLGVKIDLRFTEGREADLAAALGQTSGVTLVCWVHTVILPIVKALAPGVTGVPSQWPNENFNGIFRFDRPDAASPWAFQQIAPVLLKGDTPDPIPL